MRILDQNDKEIQLKDCDLTIGHLTEEIIIKDNAIPIDNETKYAWDEDDYETIQRYYVPSEDAYYEREIYQLKANLAATDYVVIKIAEGSATTEEYAQVISDREFWRTEINELQSKLDVLTATKEAERAAQVNAQVNTDNI